MKDLDKRLYKCTIISKEAEIWNFDKDKFLSSIKMSSTPFE